jgi:hypothetical protein
VRTRMTIITQFRKRQIAKTLFQNLVRQDQHLRVEDTVKSSASVAILEDEDDGDNHWPRGVHRETLSSIRARGAFLSNVILALAPIWRIAHSQFSCAIVRYGRSR